jgi:hypothetical protein
MELRTMKTKTWTLAALCLTGAAGLSLPAFAQTTEPAPSHGRKAMSDADITKAVEAKGYTDVQITGREASHVDVTAMKGGKSVKLAVDPATGHIKADTDKNKASPY